MRALLKDSGMRTFTQTFSSASPGRWPRLWLFCVLLVYNVSCDQFGSDDEIAGEGSFCVYFIVELVTLGFAVDTCTS